MLTREEDSLKRINPLGAQVWHDYVAGSLRGRCIYQEVPATEGQMYCLCLTERQKSHCCTAVIDNSWQNSYS